MNKEKLIIPQEVFEKEIRYKIMAKFLKRRELAGNTETIFDDLEMKNPIAIMGVRKAVSLRDFEKQLEILIEKGYLRRKGDIIRITKSGEYYATSPKGESFGILSDY